MRGGGGDRERGARVYKDFFQFILPSRDKSLVYSLFFFVIKLSNYYIFIMA